MQCEKGKEQIKKIKQGRASGVLNSTVTFSVLRGEGFSPPSPFPSTFASLSSAKFVREERGREAFVIRNAHACLPGLKRKKQQQKQQQKEEKTKLTLNKTRFFLQISNFLMFSASLFLQESLKS